MAKPTQDKTVRFRINRKAWTLLQRQAAKENFISVSEWIRVQLLAQVIHGKTA